MVVLSGMCRMKFLVPHKASTQGVNTVSTKQEGMEQPLEEHEQAARSFMASHAQIVWSVSTGTTVDDAPLCRVFIGQGEEEMLGQSWLEAVHPHDRERMMYTWRNTLVTLKACETSCRLP